MYLDHNIGQPWFASLANSILNTDEIKIFPNPASEYIFIDGIETPTRVLIYTLSGQKVVATRTFY